MLAIFFSDFQWYRRWKGGVWYNVVDPLSSGGMQGDIAYWTQVFPKEWYILLKKEEW